MNNCSIVSESGIIVDIFYDEDFMILRVNLSSKDGASITLDAITTASVNSTLNSLYSSQMFNHMKLTRPTTMDIANGIKRTLQPHSPKVLLSGSVETGNPISS
jgi:hypothetical protein